MSNKKDTTEEMEAMRKTTETMQTERDQREIEHRSEIEARDLQIAETTIDAYLKFLRKKKTEDIPTESKSKVMKYMDRNFSLNANETTIDNTNPYGYITGVDAESCSSTAAGMYHFLCNRYASDGNSKTLDMIREKHTGKDFKEGLLNTTQALYELGPTLFLFHTEAHRFCILRANENESCILHSNQDESSISFKHAGKGAKFSFPDYLNTELFPTFFIMDDDFVTDLRVSTVPPYTPKVIDQKDDPSFDDHNPIRRIRRFIQFRGDTELVQFFMDMERTRNNTDSCQNIYEKYFGIPFKFDKVYHHWFIAAPILLLTEMDATD
jgi:hypothetical protein